MVGLPSEVEDLSLKPSGYDSMLALRTVDRRFHDLATPEAVYFLNVTNTEKSVTAFRSLKEYPRIVDSVHEIIFRYSHVPEPPAPILPKNKGRRGRRSEPAAGV